MYNIVNIFKKDGISNPPWDYYFLKNLNEKEYPKYLAKLFYLNTGEKLPLKWNFKNRAWIIDKKGCKTFNQKLQWIKLYGVTPLMRDLTDKVKVRDYVKEKIGEEYLKPVLQIIPNKSHETMGCHCEQVNDNLGLAWQSKGKSNDKIDCHDTQNEVVSRLRFPKFQFRENWVLAEYNDGESSDVTTYFDKIDFDKLPNAFVLKANHGCKWQYIIKDKEQFLKNKRLFEIVKKNTTGWLEQDYSFWEGFELNYHDIKPKILIEPLLREEINTHSKQIQVYFSNNLPKLVIKIHNEKEITIWDENLKITTDPFGFEEEIINIEADELIKQTFVLSKQLVKDLNTIILRIDWMIYKDKPYFEEFTFTPYSGFKNFKNKKGIL